MKTVDEWKVLLRARLRAALGAKDKSALTVLRETLAAIDNAEAPPVRDAPSSASSDSGPFAGSAGNVGAGEIERLSLSPEAVISIVEREIRERREAVAEYLRLGRRDEADTLSSQADVLADVLAEANRPDK